MAVQVGSARIDERSKAKGGKAGDNNGKEVSTQNWYKHSKGWVLIRPKSPELGKHIAWCMKKACANDNIGYDQNQRDTLYKAAKPFDFDVTKVTTPVETDCSALVRVCVLYGFKKLGITAELGSFSTGTQVSHLRATKQFDILTASKYVNQSTYLRAGDILVTATKGHTVVVLNDGPKAYEGEVALGTRALAKGSVGTDVAALQELLASLGHDPQGIDGDFGPNTEKAVKSAQKALGLGVTGKADLATIAAIQATASAKNDPDEPEPEPEPESGWKVTATELNVRTGPSTDFSIVTTVKKNALLVPVDTEGWVPVLVGGETLWASTKYLQAVNVKGVNAV